MVKKHGSNHDKFVYKGLIELVDLEVVVGSALEDERTFEVSTSEGSFVVYAGKKYLSFLYINKLKLIAVSATEERDDSILFFFRQP